MAMTLAGAGVLALFGGNTVDAAAPGAQQVERGMEQTGDYDGRMLMTTKYCLRYELGCCLHPDRWEDSVVAGKNVNPLIDLTDTLLLRNQNHLFRLEFDCRQCLMRIYKS